MIVFIILLSLLAVSIVTVVLLKRQQMVSADDNLRIKYALTRLDIDSSNYKALNTLIFIYYKQKEWKKCMHYALKYFELYSSEATDRKYSLYVGVSAYYLKSYDIAVQYLSLYINYHNEDVLAYYYLACTYYYQQKYKLAYNQLKILLMIEPEHLDAIKYLGMIQKEMGNLSEAFKLFLQYVSISQARNLEINYEVLYYLAFCYLDNNQIDKALTMFLILKDKEPYNITASLQAGLLYMQMSNYERVCEILLPLLNDHVLLDEEFLEIHYLIGMAYYNQKHFDDAMKFFRIIYDKNPEYKDVNFIITQLTDFALNKNFAIYKIGRENEFIAIAREIVQACFKKSSITFKQVKIKNDVIDILADVKTTTSEDNILFRFFRTDAPIGEIVIREFSLLCKDVHAGRGFCFSSSGFSQAAYAFVQARYIDLKDKADLLNYLSTIHLNEA